MKLHLPRKLLTSLATASALAIGLPTQAGDIISVNFCGTDNAITSSTTGSVNGVGAAGWINVSQSGTSTLKNQDGTTIAGSVVTTMAQALWGSNVTPSDLVTTMLKGYMDLSSNNNWKLDFRTDFYVSTVSLYFSGDGSGSYTPVSINGTKYINNTTTNTAQIVTENTDWGSRDDQHVTTINAQNSIVVRGVTGGVLDITNVPMNDSNKRATLAGIQVQDTTELIAWSAELTDAATTDVSTISWSKGSQAAANIADAALMLRTSGSATLALTADATYHGIICSAGNLTVSGSNVTIADLFAMSGTTLALNATLAEQSTLNIGGKGTVSIATSQNLQSMQVNGALVVNEGVALHVNNGLSLSTAGHLTLRSGSSAEISAAGMSQMIANPYFVQLFQNTASNLRCEGTAALTIVGNLDLVDQDQDSTSITLTQGIHSLNITGNLALNRWHAATWQVNNDHSLTVGDTLELKTKQTLAVSDGGRVEAGSIVLGHEESGNFPGHLRLGEGGSVKTGSIYLRRGNGNDTFVMEGGKLEFAPTETVNSVITRDNTASAVKLVGGTLKASEASWAVNLGTEGTALKLGAVTIETATNKSISLGGAINLVGGITNKGTLILGSSNANIAINGADLGGFTSVSGNTGSYSEGQNGWMQGSYYLVQNSGSGASTTLVGSVQLNGSALATTTTDNGSITFSVSDTSAYYVNEGTVVYNTTGSGNIIAASTTSVVLAGGTLDVQSSLAATLTGITAQSGTLQISNGASLSNTDVIKSGSFNLVVTGQGSIFTHGGDGGENAYLRGTVEVRDGGKLIVSKQDALGWGSSATPSILLDNGTLELGNRQTMTTAIELRNGSTITGNGLDPLGGGITAVGTGNTIESIYYARQHSVITVESGAELTLSGGIQNSPSTGFANSIAKAGAGELIVTAASGMSGQFTNSAGTTTLRANMSMTGGLEVTNGSTLAVTNGAKLTVSGGNIIGSGTISVAKGATLALGHRGSSTISGIMISDVSGANITLQGLKGLFSQSQTIRGNVTLNDTNVTTESDTASRTRAAVVMNNGSNNETHTFSGSISGSGSIARISQVGQTQNYVFSGDVSGWTGAFIYTMNSGDYANKDTNVTFSGAATDINAKITNDITDDTLLSIARAENITPTANLSPLRVFINNAGNSVALNGSIAATSLSVTEGTAVSINNAVAVNTLTLNANTTIDLGASGSIQAASVALGTGVQVGADIAAAMRQLDTETGLTLISGISSLTLGGTSYSEAIALGNYAITGLDDTQYWLTYDNSELKLYNRIAASVPEPTSATLSLLALAGLAARRRRR